MLWLMWSVTYSREAWNTCADVEDEIQRKTQSSRGAQDDAHAPRKRTILCVAPATATAFAAMSDTHAVILSTSRLFHNYRHAANALLVYDAVRRLGLPDSALVPMLAEHASASAAFSAAVDAREHVARHRFIPARY